MEMHTIDNLKEMLCQELDEIVEKGKLTAGDLDTVHKLTDTIKNLDKIEMLEDDGYSQDGGYSRNGDWEARGSYGGNRGSSYGDGNSYDDGGNSYARRGQHYVRGHYSRSGRMYSRNDGKDATKRELERMMQEMDGSERETIRKALDIVKRI